VHSSAKALMSLLNDILDFSKIEAGELTLDETPFDLEKLVTELESVMGIMAAEKSVQFVLEYEISLLQRLVGDAHRLRQILTNLLGNAIKFTSQGSVTLRVVPAQTASSDFPVCIRFEVKDTGIGIMEEYLPHIFNKFTQGGSSITSNFGGTGLGLAITKQLVEAMHGTIGVNSQYGKGATFWFEMSFAIDTTKSGTAGTKSHANEPINEKIRNARVLVVDDHYTNQLFATKLLKKQLGIDADTVGNGIEALEKLAQMSYDLILMDCHMPQMNGFDTTTRIREMEKSSGEHVPIIALTADAMKVVKHHCITVGMDDYLSKPLDPEEFIRKVASSLTDDIKTFRQNGFNQSAAVERTDSQPVHLDHLRKFTDGDPKEDKELCESFLDQAEEMLKSLDQSCSDNQGTKWRQAAHKFKGSSANLGAFDLSKLCEEAESAFAASEEEKKVHVENIRQELGAVREFLSDILA